MHALMHLLKIRIAVCCTQGAPLLSLRNKTYFAFAIDRGGEHVVWGVKCCQRLLIILGMQNDRRIPFDPVVVIGERFAEMGQGYDRLLFFADMKSVKKILAFGAAVEIAGRRNDPWLQLAFLRLQNKIA